MFKCERRGGVFSLLFLHIFYFLWTKWLANAFRALFCWKQAVALAVKQPNLLNSTFALLPPPTPTTLSFPESLYHPAGWTEKKKRVWVSFLLAFLDREIYHNLQPPLSWKRRGTNLPCFSLLICLSTDEGKRQTRQEDFWGNLEGNTQ